MHCTITTMGIHVCAHMDMAGLGCIYSVCELGRPTNMNIITKVMNRMNSCYTLHMHGLTPLYILVVIVTKSRAVVMENYY